MMVQKNRFVFSFLFFTWLFCFNSIEGFAQKVNKVKETYPNGQKKAMGKMKGEAKIGAWVYYSEAGLLTAREKWKDGRFVWRIEYNEKQKPARAIDAKGKVRLYKGCNCKN